MYLITQDKTFSHAGHLKKHLRKHIGENIYEGNICEKQFAIFSNLQTHPRTHSGEKP